MKFKIKENEKEGLHGDPGFYTDGRGHLLFLWTNHEGLQGHGTLTCMATQNSHALARLGGEFKRVKSGTLVELVQP
jgi:hypothetical protein